MPPPPHVWPITVQAPHEMVPPQPSAIGPQLRPIGHAVSGAQPPSTRPEPLVPQRFGVPPPPHVSPAVAHAPQLMIAPQPSPTGPQFAFWLAQVRGVQPIEPPHCEGTPPPPHVWGGVQVPQFKKPPQPSPTGPHVAIAEAHDTRLHSCVEPPSSPASVPLKPPPVAIPPAVPPPDPPAVEPAVPPPTLDEPPPTPDDPPPVGRTPASFPEGVVPQVQPQRLAETTTARPRVVDERNRTITMKLPGKTRSPHGVLSATPPQQGVQLQGKRKSTPVDSVPPRLMGPLESRSV